MHFNPHLLMQKSFWREESYFFEPTAMFSPPLDIHAYMCDFCLFVCFSVYFLSLRIRQQPLNLVAVH